MDVDKDKLIEDLKRKREDLEDEVDELKGKLIDSAGDFWTFAKDNPLDAGFAVGISALAGVFVGWAFF